MLFYKILYVRSRGNRKLQNGTKFVSVNEFQTYSAHVPEGMKDFDENVHNAWILFAAFILLQQNSRPAAIFEAECIYKADMGKIEQLFVGEPSAVWSCCRLL